MREATKKTTPSRRRRRGASAVTPEAIGTAVAAQQPGEFIEARCAIEVEVNEPIGPNAQRIIRGRLRGEHRIGAHLVYYKIRLGDGTVYLARPEWMSPDSVVEIERERRYAEDKWQKAEYYGALYSLTDTLDRIERDAPVGRRAAR